MAEEESRELVAVKRRVAGSFVGLLSSMKTESWVFDTILNAI